MHSLAFIQVNTSLQALTLLALLAVSYYEGLQKCAGLYRADGQYSSDEIVQLISLYGSLGEQFAWSSAVKVKTSCYFMFPKQYTQFKIHNLH